MKDRMIVEYNKCLWIQQELLKVSNEKSLYLYSIYDEYALLMQSLSANELWLSLIPDNELSFIMHNVTKSIYTFNPPAHDNADIEVIVLEMSRSIALVCKMIESIELL